MVETITKDKEELKKSRELNLNSKQEEAIKSLVAGYGYTPETQEDGGALKVESLDPQLHNLTFGSNDFTILPALFDIGVHKAQSPVEKYITFDKHGRIGHSIFQPEIGISDVNSPHIHQHTINMKYMTDVKQQSMAMSFTSTVEDAASINEQDAMIVIGKTAEWAIFYGDADMTSDQAGTGLQFDGLQKLIPEKNHLDIRGQSLTPEVLNQAAVLIGKGFGVATDAFMPIGVKADFGNQFLGAQRVLVPTNDGTTAGVNVDHFISARGNIRLNGSTIMDADNILDLEEIPAPQAPAQPAITAAEKPNAGSEKEVFFREAEKDGDVVVAPAEIGAELEYRAVAVGHHGDSFASDVAKATPTAANSAIELTVSLDSMQREIPDFVRIYRKSLVDGEFYLVGQVATRDIDTTTGAITFTDRNARIPGTADVFIGEVAQTVIQLMQFIPMTRINLAVVTTATSFVVTTAMALALYIPSRWVQVHNVRYNNIKDNHLGGVKVQAFIDNK
ncbi:hypothetical protein GPK34_00865 [Secundilactobacillus kimchicus]|uniref:SU10 major capsid protein n=1 Tax=Secundilactobacillus kimchicus TaxID=528209 RepID=UPI001C00FDCE|nr:capsid protein [Secundilactobacillus kimchicus]MBT9670590.1 hypothetical protein [Secundilactobacillus kimchicus]